MGYNSVMRLTRIFASLALMIMISCSKGSVKNGDILNNDKKKPEDNNKFLKEGFLSRSKFRVIIISTKSECENELQSIKEKSKQRALVSLQRHLASQNIQINRNTRTRILNLINDSGNFSRQKSDCVKNNVFYLDINKDNLKRYLKRSSR